MHWGALKLDSQPPWLQPCESVDACFEGASRTFNSLKRACRKVPDCRSRSIADPSRTLGLGQFGEDLHLGFSQLDLERFLGWRVFRFSVDPLFEVFMHVLRERIGAHGTEGDDCVSLDMQPRHSVLIGQFCVVPIVLEASFEKMPNGHPFDGFTLGIYHLPGENADRREPAATAVCLFSECSGRRLAGAWKWLPRDDSGSAISAGLLEQQWKVRNVAESFSAKDAGSNLQLVAGKRDD